jgi:hypothetical protein
MIRSASKVAVAAMLLFGAKTAIADEFQALSVCHAKYPTNAVAYTQFGLENNESSTAVDIYCPLKAVTTANGTTYSATVYGADNNSTNDSTHNVICDLNYINKGTGGFSYQGTPVTLPYGSGTATISVTVSNGSVGGVMFMHCSIGMTSGSGSSYVNWVSTSF